MNDNMTIDPLHGDTGKQPRRLQVFLGLGNIIPNKIGANRLGFDALVAFHINFSGRHLRGERKRAKNDEKDKCPAVQKATN